MNLNSLTKFLTGLVTKAKPAPQPTPEVLRHHVIATRQQLWEAEKRLVVAQAKEMGLKAYHVTGHVNARQLANDIFRIAKSAESVMSDFIAMQRNGESGGLPPSCDINVISIN